MATTSFSLLLAFLVVVMTPLSVANIVVGSMADTRGCIAPTPPYGLPFAAWDMPSGLVFIGCLSLAHLAFVVIMWALFCASGHYCYVRVLRVVSAGCNVVGSLTVFANAVVLFSRTYGWCPYDSFVKLAVGNFIYYAVLVTIAQFDALGKFLDDA